MKLLFFGLLALTAVAALALAAQPGTAFAAGAHLAQFGETPPWGPRLHVPTEHYVEHVGHTDNGLDSVSLCATNDSKTSNTSAPFSAGTGGSRAFGLRGMNVSNDGPDETNPQPPAGTETPSARAVAGLTEADIQRIAADIIARASQPTADGVEAAAAQAAQDRATGADAPQRSAAPTLVPEGQRTPEQRGDAGGAVSGARVVADRQWDGDDAVLLQTARMLTATFRRDDRAAAEIRHGLETAGHFRAAINGETRDVATTDDQGQPFLPVVVSDRIEQIALEVGVVTRLCQVYDITSGTLKVPNVPNVINVSAINEGAEIPGVNFDPAGITLDPKKWGGIAGWTTEMSDEVGVQYVRALIQAVGNGFGVAMDGSVFMADGTAAFHGLTGILNDAGVSAYEMPAGMLTMRDATYDDCLSLEEQPVSGARSRATKVFHPDFKLVLRRMKEGDGSRTFAPGSDPSTDGFAFTEALPSRTEVVADTPFGAAGDFSHVTIARQRGITFRLFEAGTIKRADNTAFNLVTQDAQALRFTSRWTPGYGLKAAFGRIKTPAV